MLELINLSKNYGLVIAVKQIDLSIEKGEFFCLLGPSGGGKTTVLRMIAGFERPTGGEIWLNGKNITHLPPNERDVNTVFQNYALFLNCTVRDNIGYGLRVINMAKDESDERVA